jgi:hypothetical protein
MTTIKEAYGPYRLTITYKPHNYAQVTMENIADKWPLLWSMGLNYEAANGALELFKAIGYFDIMATT